MLKVETENFKFFIKKNIDFSLWGNHGSEYLTSLLKSCKCWWPRPKTLNFLFQKILILVFGVIMKSPKHTLSYCTLTSKTKINVFRNFFFTPDPLQRTTSQNFFEKCWFSVWGKQRIVPKWTFFQCFSSLWLGLFVILNKRMLN